MTEPGTFAAPTLAPLDATIPPPPNGGAPQEAPQLPSSLPAAAPSLAVPTLPGPASPTGDAPAPAPGPNAAPAPIPPPTATPPPSAAPSLPSIPDVHVPAPVPFDGPPQPSDAISTPSEIPEWKRRQNSKLRKLVRRLIALAVLGGIGAAGYFVYLGFDEQDGAAAQTSGADGDATLFDDTRELVDGINDNQIEAELLGELGLDATGGTAAPVQSFTHTYTFGSTDTVTTSVDATTGDAIRSDADGEVRSIDGLQYHVVAGTWTEVTDQTPIENVDLLRPAAIVPDSMIPFIVSSAPVDATTVSYEVDEFEFSSMSLDGWRVWNTRWTRDAVRTPVIGDRVSITISLNSEGLVSAATVVLPSGEVTSYRLDDWSSEPLPVELR